MTIPRDDISTNIESSTNCVGLQGLPNPCGARWKALLNSKLWLLISRCADTRKTMAAFASRARSRPAAIAAPALELEELPHDFSCPICFELMDTLLRSPLRLSGCTHKVCRVCQPQLRREDGCPICRKPYYAAEQDWPMTVAVSRAASNRTLACAGCGVRGIPVAAGSLHKCPSAGSRGGAGKKTTVKKAAKTVAKTSKKATTARQTVKKALTTATAKNKKPAVKNRRS